MTEPLAPADHANNPGKRGRFSWVMAPFRRFGAKGDKPAKVHVIQLHGAIMPSGGGGPFNSGPVLNIDGLEEGIEAAFKPLKNKPGALAAIALNINCPGGSPVQSSLIAGRIRQLADQHQVPVLAYVQDVAASGGYWLASAADEIIADPSSIVGSIGVISAGFGFTGTLDKLGVERRLHTAGANKSRLDSFSPEKPEDVDWLLSMQSKLHETFREQVRARRGEKLVGNEDELMNGEVWLGKEAVALGLVDAIGSMHADLRARFGDKVKIKRFGVKKKGLLSGLPFVGDSSWSAQLADGLVASIERRAMWSRFGL